MAFQPPAADRRQQISSVNSHPIQEHHDFYLDSPTSPTFSRPFDLPAAPEEEWIVFSPSVTVESDFTATEIGTNDGRHGPSDFWTEGTESRLSGTHNRSSYHHETEAEDDDEEEDHMAYHDGYMRELDDDEDSLQPFRENPVLLPTHDGMGMFPSQNGEEDATVFMPGVESLEKSLRLLAGRHSNFFEEEEDVNSRIQKWRLEHSNAFLEEMQEARNRKIRAGFLRTQSSKALREEMEASMMLDDEDYDSEHTSIQRGESVDGHQDGEVPETFWRKITRSLMRDIMGIDDTVLEVIFGESLPPLALNPPAPPARNEIIGEKWERSLLERIARELGILLQQYTVHPTQGAFSTYTRTNSSVMLADDKTKLGNDGGVTPRARSLRSTASLANLPALSNTGETLTDSVDPADKVQFMPTLSQRRRNHAASRPKLWAEEEAQTAKKKAVDEASIDAQSRKDYWEQELGVSVFFSYIKSRFTSSQTPSTPAPPSTKSLRKAASSADMHRPIYHQHPLLQRRHQTRRSVSASSQQSSPGAIANSSWNILGLGGYRNGSSCASQSTKTSKAVPSKGKGKVAQGPASTLSKSYYWEVDTSVSSTGGSCMGMGIWGEI
ncbi:hypothetical protein DFH27DRAFT_523134 [Peziza echinospora]|nr:hypothetical protein DFH27DRAFT_523134 [Peziza echinospora]